MLLVDRLSTFSELGNSPHESIPFSVLRIGSSALQHWWSAMYSALVELSSISVCSLFYQCIGTPAKMMIKAVRILDVIHQRSHCRSMCQVKDFYLVS
jgi:hypothetical protein